MSLILMTGVTITTIKYRGDRSVTETVDQITTESPSDFSNVEFIVIENGNDDYRKEINKRENSHVNYRNSRVYQERFTGNFRNDREAILSESLNQYQIADNNASQIDYERRAKVKEVSDQFALQQFKEFDKKFRVIAHMLCFHSFIRR